jgi:hypothetical protein
MMWNAFKRWPLLVVGLLTIGWAISIQTDQDPTESRALLFGVGAVLLGAGLAVVIFGYYDDRQREKEDRDKEV